jgi:xanthine dehydrogenase accessory factor
LNEWSGAQVAAARRATRDFDAPIAAAQGTRAARRASERMLQAAMPPDWPMFGLIDDVRPALARAAAEGRTVALATLFEVVGGSPRPVGSQMLIDRVGPHGFLSGGCIEADVCARAARVLETGDPTRLRYGEGGPYADIRLVCGGRIEVLLERVDPDDAAVRTLLALGTARREALWVSDGVTRACWAADPGAPPAGGLEPVARALADPAVGCAVLGEGSAIGLRRAPQTRLIVVGADPIALAIAGLAVQSGFETWLVRPRGPEAPPPIGGVRYDRREVEVALPAIGLDRWTYVAVATHDISTDDVALAAALTSQAPYVGALGARRRLPERLARLRARGVTDAEMAKLRAPIGLDIGGKAPFEIAVSVLAEIIAEYEANRPRGWVRVEAAVERR